MNTFSENLKIKSIDPIMSPALIHDRNNQCNYPDVQIILSYHNFLPFDVVVVMKNGLKLTIPSKANVYREKTFFIRQELRISDSRQTNLDKFMSHVTNKDSQEILTLHEIYISQKNVNLNNSVTAYLDYTVTIEDLKDSNGCFYYQQMDCVVSSLSYSDTPMHPFSTRGIALAGSMNNISLDAVPVVRNVLLTKIEVIDNNRQYGEHFCRILNNIYKIPSRKDLSKLDGIYLTHTENDIKDINGVEFITEYFDFNTDLKSIGVFKTEQEAFNSADINLIRKEEILRLEHELNIHKAEFNKVKTKFDTESLHKQQELNEMSFEMKRKEHSMKLKESELSEKQAVFDKERKQIEFELDRKRQQMKDDYEQRNNERKESQELIKMLPVLILTVGAVITAFMKFGNSPKKS